MSRGYSVAQTARLVCALRWTCTRLSEILDAWSTQAATPGEPSTGQAADAVGPSTGQAANAAAPDAEAAVRLMELSRRLASHRETLDGLQPDSERMAPWRQPAPADQALAAALDELAELEGPAERVAVAVWVIVPALAEAYGEIEACAAPHCDAALASAARALRHDLEGGAEPAGPLPSSHAEAAGSALSAAGGIVAQSLLRPEDWA